MHIGAEHIIENNNYKDNLKVINKSSPDLQAYIKEFQKIN